VVRRLEQVDGAKQIRGAGQVTLEVPREIFAHAWQTTIRHIQVLEAAGLIKHERQGRMRIYRIERKRLALVSEWLAHYQKPVRHRIRGLQDVKDKDNKGH
jgi:DNA-binding transcriptional ArsR family regulator